MKLETAVSSQQEGVFGNQTGIMNNIGFSCMNNCEDHTFCTETFSHHNKLEEAEDLEVDIIDCTDNTPGSVHFDDNPAVTEHSSSFDDTFSSSDDRVVRYSNDVEVESQFCGENENTLSNGFHMLFGKKKLTPHWWKYIQPLRWRCKWLELRMKELHSQAVKYEKELSVYNDGKSLQMKMVTLNKSAARTVPLTCRNQSKYAMKRRTRKKIEDTVDVSSYMSCHNLFSYYEKGHEADGVSVDESFADCVTIAENVRDHDDFGLSFDWSVVEFMGDGSSLEQILSEIEAIKSRVLQLKAQLNNGICLSSEFVAGGPPSWSALSLRCSLGNNVDASTYTLPTRTSDYEIEDPVMPESAVSSYGDAAIPDIIESTGVDDGILIKNQAAELQNFNKVGHSADEVQGTIVEKEEGERSVTPETESEMDRAAVAEQQQPAPKRCSEPTTTTTTTTTYVRRSKRKRVERRVSPGGWHGERWRRRSLKNAKYESQGV